MTRGFFVGKIIKIIPKDRTNEMINVPMIKISFNRSDSKNLLTPNPM